MQPHVGTISEHKGVKIRIYDTLIEVEDVELYDNGVEGEFIDLLIHAKDKKRRTIITRVDIYRE